MTQRQESSSGDEEKFLADVRAWVDDGGAAASAVSSLFDWSKHVGLRCEFDCKSRGPQCLIKLHRPPRGITLLHLEAAGKYTWLGMQWLRAHSPFCQEDVQAELRTKIEGLPDGCYSFHREGIRGQPSFDLSMLASVDHVKAFIDVVEWMVDQWRASHPEEP